jgi:NitT/TauT family transport system ATP-binding protein
VKALAGIDLNIGEREFVSFLGPSGCGKTTLLKMIDAMVQPDAGGSISINGKTASEAVDGVGFVFQDVALLPWRTVRANVALGLQARGRPRAEYTETAMEFIRLVGLEKFADYYPYQLSGGMQQRVGLARALAIAPEVLLMDEPFGALDAITRKTLQEELTRIWDVLDVTVIFVTHDVHEAIFLSDRVVVFGGSPGHIEADVHVNLPRPRADYDVPAHPSAISLYAQLNEMLQAVS